MARGKWSQGIFEPSHPEKYIGKGRIKFRSGWEKTMMIFLDNHPSILQWSSESIIIPYTDCLTKKKKNYIPDFFIIYVDKLGVKKAEIIEVKPSKQAGLTKTKSLVEQAQVLKNRSKWEAAKAWADKQGIGFRVVTELSLFRGPK